MRLLKKNKRAIQLSINFIVLLILGMSMLAGGLLFVNKFFTKAQSIKGSLDSQTERQIEAMLDSGSPFVIPIHTKSIARKEHAVFRVGLYNIYDVEKKITLNVKFVKAFDRNKGDIPLSQVRLKTQYFADPVTIDKNEKEKQLILFEAPADTKSGTYIYEVEALSSGTYYEPSLQIIVNVK